MNDTEALHPFRDVRPQHFRWEVSGDVHEIIGPLTRMTAPEPLAFTRMTGDLVLAMRKCPQPGPAVPT